MDPTQRYTPPLSPSGFTGTTADTDAPDAVPSNSQPRSPSSGTSSSTASWELNLVRELPPIGGWDEEESDSDVELAQVEATATSTDDAGRSIIRDLAGRSRTRENSSPVIAGQIGRDRADCAWEDCEESAEGIRERRGYKWERLPFCDEHRPKHNRLVEQYKTAQKTRTRIEKSRNVRSIRKAIGLCGDEIAGRERARRTLKKKYRDNGHFNAILHTEGAADQLRTRLLNRPSIQGSRSMSSRQPQPRRR